MDKDGNGTIEIEEFASVFGLATEKLKIDMYQVNSRSNLMLCFSKAFAGGIDVEKLFLDNDP
jgi:hypothetical protein